MHLPIHSLPLNEYRPNSKPFLPYKRSACLRSFSPLVHPPINIQSNSLASLGQKKGQWGSVLTLSLFRKARPPDLAIVCNSGN
jgi:hypothetical protein